MATLLSLPFRWPLPKIVWKWLFSGSSSSWLESVDCPVQSKAGPCFPGHLFVVITCSFHSPCCWLPSCLTNLITSQMKNPIAYQSGLALEHSGPLQSGLTHCDHLASHCSSHLWTGVSPSLSAGWVTAGSATVYKMGLPSDMPASDLWETWNYAVKALGKLKCFVNIHCYPDDVYRICQLRCKWRF